MAKASSPQIYNAFRYLSNDSTFLNHKQAEYALACLWERVAGSAEWEGPSALTIPAIGAETVDDMFSLADHSLPWIELRDILPPGVDLGLDTDRLPILCNASNGVSPGGNLFEKALEQSKTGGEPPVFPFDLVSATFLLLSRWEEWNRNMPLDRRGNILESARFPARQGFLDRPVLDEWALVVRAWLEALAPRWQAKPPAPRIIPTHDIDHAFRYPSLRVLPRRFGGALLRERSARDALKVLWEGMSSSLSPQNDPNIAVMRVRPLIRISPRPLAKASCRSGTKPPHGTRLSIACRVRKNDKTFDIA